MVATQTGNWPILYIHPDTQMEMDAVIPIGMVGLANSLPGQVLGRLWSEVSDEEIAAARVVALDLHWFWSMRSFIALTGRIRRVAPTTPIVTGGYTATAFGPRLIAGGYADYVVLGDAERAFPELVTRLLCGEREVRGLANVVTREEARPRMVPATAEDLAGVNFRDFGFMPTLERWVGHVQRQAANWNHNMSMFPYVPIMRGCGMRETIEPCNVCTGNRTWHRAFSGRGPLIRPAEAIHRDLDAFEARGYGFVSVLSDVAGICPPRVTREVFHKRRGQKIYYALWKMPAPEGLSCLLDTFAGGHIEMSDTCGSPESLFDPKAEEAFRLFARDGRYHVTLYVDLARYQGDGAMYERVKALRRIFACDVSSMSYWYSIAPPHRESGGEYAGEAEFERFSGFDPGVPSIAIQRALLRSERSEVRHVFYALRRAATARSLTVLSPGYGAARGALARVVGRVSGAAV